MTASSGRKPSLWPQARRAGAFRRIRVISIVDRYHRRVLADGRSSRVTPGDEPPLRSQERLYALAGPAGEFEPSDPLGLPSS